MSEIPLWILLASIAFLVLMSAFFSGSETSMMAINRYRLKHLVKEKNKSAKRVSKLLERTDRLLGVILIGSAGCMISMSVLSNLSIYLFESALLNSPSLLAENVLTREQVIIQTLSTLSYSNYLLIGLMKYFLETVLMKLLMYY